MTKHWTVLATASLATLLALFAPAPVARADIFKWEYINPANPSQGKQPSTTLTPDGAGANAVPGTNLSNRNLTMAYLIDANVSTYLFSYGDGRYSYVASNLTAVNLSQADLANASFRGWYGYNVNWAFTVFPGADLTDANLIQANATNASFQYATLSGANLSQADLTNANFTFAAMTNANLSQANLTNANLFDATLIGANLTNAEVRGADLGGTGITVAQLYTTASYQAHDLTGIGLSSNNLGGANLAGQNLTSASLQNTTLTSANLTGAEVRGANFSRSSYYDGTGISAAQLYLTASYQAHDLSGIGLGLNDLAGVNFAGQNLTSASFRGFFIDVDEAGVSTNLSGANFSGADARWADFYATTLSGANLSQANLQNANFSGDWNNNAFTDLANANLSGADARGASFYLAALSGANFTDADVRGADFYYSGFTAAQLYSTASYQAHDLTGVKMVYHNLAGVNLANQNLTNANFGSATLTGANLSQANATHASFDGAGLAGANLSQANLTNASLFATLTNANLSQANLTNANFSYLSSGAILSGANLSGADARGANFYAATLTGANTSNLIQSVGHIAGLDLTAGASLVVRDYDGNPDAGPPTGPLPIVVDQHLAMDATGTLRLVFDADPWDSTISFAPGLPVARGGTLELTFAPDVNVATQIGRTIDLFNWTAVTPTGAFTVSSPYTWNLTKLYTTGEVILTALAAIPGDFNNNGVVDAADYIVWRKTDGTPAGYNAWRTHFGMTAGSGSVSAGVSDSHTAVPEPSTSVLFMFAAAGWSLRRRRAAKNVSKLVNA